MNEQGPRPLIDAEEVTWAVRLMAIVVGIPVLAYFAGVVAGLAVAGFRMVT